MMDGWSVSDGLQIEEDIFHDAGKPVLRVSPFLSPSHIAALQKASS